MIESEGRVREQQACIWAANNNRPWCGHWRVAVPFSPPLLPFLRIIFSNALCRPITAAGWPGTRAGTVGDATTLQPPVTRESLVQRVSQIRFPCGC